MGIFRRIGIGLLCVSAGCASVDRTRTVEVRVPSGPYVPAALRPDDGLEYCVCFVDGEWAPFLPQPRRLPRENLRPGMTCLAVRLVSSHAFSPVDPALKFVAFEAVPGHTYGVEPVLPLRLRIAYLPKADYEVRVIDRTTGRVVRESHDDDMPATKPVRTPTPATLSRPAAWAMLNAGGRACSE